MTPTNRTELLQSLATEAGINITNTEGRNAVRSILVKLLTDQGLTTKAAYDFTWGEGSFDKLANNVYDQFNAA
jgi:hypothetical protein